MASVWTGSLVVATVEMLHASGCAVEQVVDSHDEQWARLAAGEHVFRTEPVGDAREFAAWLAQQDPPMREISATLLPPTHAQAVESRGAGASCDGDAPGAEQLAAPSLERALPSVDDEPPPEDPSWLDDI